MRVAHTNLTKNQKYGSSVMNFTCCRLRSGLGHDCDRLTPCDDNWPLVWQTVDANSFADSFDQSWMQPEVEL